jgi:excinuclease ABC subunit A
MTKHMSRQPPSIEFIELTHVRQNNLKNINVKIPLGKLTVITGLSGSGKSSLAFDTLYAEGQRRYIESLSTYTRQFLEKMPKPDLESIKNIPPAIATTAIIIVPATPIQSKTANTLDWVSLRCSFSLCS